MLYFIIAIPFLFLVGILYNAIKEQNRLEKDYLPKALKQLEQKKKNALKNVSKKNPPK